MKPKNLKAPFQFNQRQILIKDRILFMPDVCDIDRPFTFPGWRSEEIFSSDLPICIEYCSGNGAWIAERAKSEVSVNWVAVERKFDRTRKIWSKVKNFQLENLFMICGEGHSVTSEYFPSACIEGAFINFPDPWPKRKHARHRLIQPRFVQELHRILKTGKLLTIVTDDAVYSSSLIKVMQGIAGFDSIFETPYYVTHYPGYGSSFFEELWREKGKEIRYHVFRKQ
ncbi:MAG: tRNA (guanine(46)-N(7))-methyltransferase TrmB [Candidatus Protochlamydia sp.]|nr:tRNA (guanine(46)-N(7))-methyltransferase TrmB [Candidatus Protochlamydia sp.]